MTIDITRQSALSITTNLGVSEPLVRLLASSAAVELDHRRLDGRRVELHPQGSGFGVLCSIIGFRAEECPISLQRVLLLQQNQSGRNQGKENVGLRPRFLKTTDIYTLSTLDSETKLARFIK